MSKLLNQEKLLDALRAKHLRRASATPADLAPQKPEPILLLTHRQPSEPVSPARSPLSLLRLSLCRPVARWALLGVAACGVVVVTSVNRQRPSGETALPHGVSTTLTPRQLPTLAAAPQAPAGEAPSSQHRSEVDRRHRAQEMDLTLVEAQRVMALMEQAMRQAAQAYVSSPAPPSSADTSS